MLKFSRPAALSKMTDLSHCSYRVLIIVIYKVTMKIIIDASWRDELTRYIHYENSY